MSLVFKICGPFRGCIVGMERIRKDEDFFGFIRKCARPHGKDKEGERIFLGSLENMNGMKWEFKERNSFGKYEKTRF